MIILGALIGDYIGSKYEVHNTKDYSFELWGSGDRFTDDSIMTIAIIDALVTYFELGVKENYKGLGQLVIKKMVEYGTNPRYGRGRYGRGFSKWLDNPVPYNSYGNGAAMRISGAGIVARNEEEAKVLARISTDVSHNHEESERAAECVALSIFKLMHGDSKENVVKLIMCYYPNIMDINLEELRPNYKFDVSCMGSVPIALKAFIDSQSFEDALRIAISMGGDSDTIGAICCSLAAAYYDDSIEIWKIIREKCDSLFNQQIVRLERLLKGREND